jgi:hypothetical protein
LHDGIDRHVHAFAVESAPGETVHHRLQHDPLPPSDAVQQPVREEMRAAFKPLC